MKSIPYTLRSFVELAESENRRGKDISRQDLEVEQATRALSDRRQQFLSSITWCIDDESRGRIRERYREDRKSLHEVRDQAVEAAMHRAATSFEEKLARGEFTFALQPGPFVVGKSTYQIDSAFDITFPAKQAAEALKRAASMDTPSRNSIVRALKAALDKKYPHAIYKIDVKEFFESIPHSTLRQRLARYPNLDSVSLHLASHLLAEFEAMTGASIGLPRGVGLSSHLAELYLGDFDSVVMTHPGVLFYARYVDDVVIVLESEQALTEVKKAVSGELESLQLELNHEKTHELSAKANGDYPHCDVIEYLGYRFRRIDGKLTTGLTEKRKIRRMLRLELAMQSWLATSPNMMSPNSGHDGLLLDRMRYLAGNTKLLNSKSNVAIGLYFSNSALDADAEELADLDHRLNTFREQHGTKMSEKLRTRLEDISFVEMFSNKTFLRFRPRRIEQIVTIWKGVN